jgi:6-pyruvoyltetrahydropterin/6-carboxytetrahydropterin synthase
MYEVTVEDVFSSAHRLRNYKGKCENLHGHNWKVSVTVRGQNLDNIGLLIDFHIVKEKLKEVIGVLDHTDLNSIAFFKKINPTSENICFYIYRKMKSTLKKYSVEIKRVDVWESDKQYASYFEG